MTTRSMTGQSSKDDLLQQYFDGELPAAEKDALRRRLESDGDLRAKLDGLEHLSTMIRAGGEELASDLDSDALFASIEARLGERADEDDDPMLIAPPIEARLDEPEREPERSEPGGADGEGRPALRVVAGGKAGEPPAAQQSEAAPENHTRLWVGVGATMLAAAAAVLFYVFGPGADPSDGETPRPGPEEPRIVAEQHPPPGSEVEEVDFGYSTGAIFSVEGQEGEQYAVVWISDEKIEEERLQ